MSVISRFRGHSLNCPEMEFSIFFSKEEWTLLNPHNKIYKGRVYIQFDDIWTDMFNSKIWEAAHLACKWKFSHHKFHTRVGMVPFTFDASCSDRTDSKKPCGNFMYGKCFELLDNPQQVEIKIWTRNTNAKDQEVPHTQKRKIAGKARQLEGKNMKNIKAVQYQVTQANNLMDNSDPIPAHLPNLPVIRKVQQEGRDTSLCLDLYPGDPLSSLQKIQEQNTFVRFLSASPFCVHLLTDNQIKLYREALSLGFCTFSVDASGFSKAFSIMNDNKTSALFLYEISVNINGKIGSVGQMLSEAHDTCTIADWLSRWLTFVNGRPKAIIADGSLALLNAISLSLYDYSYEDYIDYCYTILVEYEQNMQVISNDKTDANRKSECEQYVQLLKTRKPDVLIFRDRNHIIKNVRHWKCFDKYKDWRISDFYTRVVGFILNIDNLKMLEETITQVFVVCNSDSIEIGSITHKSLEALTNKIETFNYDVSYEEDGQESNINHYTSSLICENFSLLNSEQKKYKIVDFVDNLYNDSLKSCVIGNREFPDPNSYKCAEISEHLKKLLYQFVVWTNVMDPLYDGIPATKSSCCSEARFKLLKTDYNIKAIQANKFVLRYISYINGESHLIRGNLKLMKLLDKNENVPKNRKNIIKKGTIQTNAMENNCAEKYVVSSDNSVSLRNGRTCKKSESLVDLFSSAYETNQSNDEISIEVIKLACTGGNLNVFRLYRAQQLQTYSIFSYKSDFWFFLHNKPSLVLHNLSVECLKRPSYINEDVIDLFMLIKYESKEWKNVAFLSCHITQLIFGQRSAETFKKPKKYFLFNKVQSSEMSYEIVFLPYALNGHWCLVVLDWQNSLFTHFDSLRLPNRQEEIKHKFDLFIEHCRSVKKPGILNLASKSWKIEDPRDQYHPQKDSYNCGCFVMDTMNNIVKNRKMAFTSFRANLYRIQILDFFFSHCSTDICLSSTCGKKEKTLGNYNVNDISTADNSFRMCNICGRWIHELCDPKRFFAGDICLMCLSPDKQDSQNLKNISSTRHNNESYTKSMDSKNKSYKGLENPVNSNTCWLNSVLQILFGLPLFTNLETQFDDGHRSNLINLFINIVRKLDQTIPGEIISAKDFKTACSILEGNFQTQQQQDVVEFIDKFFDHLVSMHHLRISSDVNFIEKNFNVSTIMFRSCKCCFLQRQVPDDHHFIMRIPIIPGFRSVEEFIEHHFNFEESVDMDCENCNEKLIEHSVIRRLNEFPQILLVQLNRFKRDGNITRKIHFPVDISEDLFLSTNIR